MFNLNHMDLFGKTFSFNINKQEQFTTKVGGILSLLVYFSFLLALWYFGQDIYLRKAPKVTKKEAQLNYYPFMILLNKTSFLDSI